MYQSTQHLHEVFEQDGKFGMKDHQGNIMLSPSYDFLRTCYIYNDDLSIMPVIAEKNGKMGLVMPDGNDTVVADFLYDEICLRDEYPYFEASREGISGFIDNKPKIIPFFIKTTFISPLSQLRNRI